MSRFGLPALALLAAGQLSPAFAAPMPAVESAPLIKTSFPSARVERLADGVVAVVDGDNVSEAEFARDLAEGAWKAKAATPEGRFDILALEVNRRLIVKEALTLGIDKQPIPARMIERRRRKLAVNALTAATRLKIEVSDAEVAARFKDPGELLSYSVMLADSPEEAVAALARVRAGEDFSAVSAEVSIPPVRGGKVSRTEVARGQGMYPKEVEDVLFGLKPGELSGPLGTEVGVIVFRMDARRRLTDEELRRGNESLRGDIYDEKFAQALGEAVSRQREKARVRIVRERYEGKDLPDPGSEGWALWDAVESIAVAEVNGTTLTLGDIFRNDNDYRMFQGKATKDKLLRDSIERAVEETLLYADARARGVEKSADIETAVGEYRKELVRSKRAYEIARKVTAGKLDQKQVRALFEERRRQYLTDDRIELSQILVRKEGEARKIESLLAKKEKYPDLAKKHSVDASGREGGKLGVLSSPDLTKRFGEEGASKLLELGREKKFGFHTIRTTSGWHIILIHRFFGAGEGSFEEVQDKVTADYLKVKQAEAVDKHLLGLRKAATIVIDVGKILSVPPSQDAAGLHGGSGGSAPHGSFGTEGGGTAPHGAFGSKGAPVPKH